MKRYLGALLLMAWSACSQPPPPAWLDGASDVQRVVVDGIELHLVTQGTGVPVVLVHGSLADYTYWELAGQMASIGARHQVIAYSRRYNHPNSNPVAEGHSAQVEADDLGRLLDHLGLDRVHLAGHSYGAYTAILFALEHPERVQSLVLAEPPILPWLPGIPGGEGIEESFMAGVWTPLAAAFREGGEEAGLEFTAQWYFDMPFASVEPRWQTLFRNNIGEWRALATSPHAFLPVDEDAVRALQVPTLLLSGGKNAGGFNDLIDGHLERLLPDVERLIVPDATHEMFLDAPDVTARAMLQFFGSR